jgi:hypothetical protein
MSTEEYREAGAQQRTAAPVLIALADPRKDGSATRSNCSQRGKGDN